MKWVLTVETETTEHVHIDVDDPETAAIVLNEINDERAKKGQGPAVARIESFPVEWVCLSCGERRFTADATAT